MSQNIISTADGSPTIQSTKWQNTWHSKYGAVQESQHVFIKHGLMPLLNSLPQINIFEMGLGTGLNALLTLIKANEQQQKIHYSAVELYPLDQELIPQLNYCSFLQKPGFQQQFLQIHNSQWEIPALINPYFTLQKHNICLTEFEPGLKYNLVYFDAFSPNEQPHLWTEAVFGQLFKAMHHNGVLVTYCCKTTVRKAMESVGFTLHKLKGPPGKREMLKAVKE